MKVVNIKPRGYCYGVMNAISTVTNAINSDVPKPINIYGMLIHNRKVVEALTAKGVNTIINPSISDLETIEGTVIFTAHGIRDNIIAKAKNLGLHVIDATCRDVIKTKNIIDDLCRDGYQVVYIGKKNHPEAISATGNKNVILVENIEELRKIDYSKKTAITNQTTMSIIDLKSFYEYIERSHPGTMIIDEICNATRRRQSAVIDSEVELLYVVGDFHSNNTRNLASLHQNSRLIESIEDINESDLYDDLIVGVTAGASTPSVLIDEIIEYLEDYPNVQKKSNISSRNILDK